MGSFVQFLQDSAIAVFVGESPSILGYTTVLALHAMGLAIVVGVSAAVALRALGLIPGVPLAPMLKLYPLIWVGFTVNALSGFALFAANASNLLASAMFLIKMLLVFASVIAMEFLRVRLARAAGTASGQISIPVPASTQVLAFATLALWASALISGRLTAYPNFVNTLLGLS